MSAARTAPLPTEGQSATLNDEQAHLESVGQYIENVQRNYSHPANLPPLPSSRGPATATDLAGFDVSPERSGDHDLEEPYSVTVFEMTCKSVINPWEGFDFQRNARIGVGEKDLQHNPLLCSLKSQHNPKHAYSKVSPTEFSGVNSQLENGTAKFREVHISKDGCVSVPILVWKREMRDLLNYQQRTATSTVYPDRAGHPL
ncbi:uncharacterized protein LOC133363284 isoform X2 [Rhineura floridana]|nr:uncharacterized protein LOC133363284 isoform X2 [Rhineura floridana]XP_061438673.1 uncharacterized protein LOC133363284 isoform X2 [Rhineura floridana]